MLVKLFYTCMCFLCNSRFKSSLELMLCVINISTLNKTYLIWFEIIKGRRLGFHYPMYHIHICVPVLCQDLDFQRHMSWSFCFVFNELSRGGGCQLIEVWCSCSLCWYWWNSWPSLLRLFFITGRWFKREWLPFHSPL